MKSVNFLIFFGTLLILFTVSYASPKSNKGKNQEKETPKYQYSLAQWSLNKQIRSGETSPYEFARIASELGFTGLEYVNQLYPEGKDTIDRIASINYFVRKSDSLATKYNMTNVLIMIDGEGNLASSDESIRLQAIENHKLWIDAANQLGCTSVRLNLYGEDDLDKWKRNSIESLRALSDYAAPKNINVIVENHGGFSSIGTELMSVINQVERENCGTLPDFGNFCITNDGWGGFDECTELYDIYKGIEEMMPKAFGLSAKCFDFDENGEETSIDYKRMLEIVKASDYKGFIGVEYEGENFSEEDGSVAGLNLLKKYLE